MSDGLTNLLGLDKLVREFRECVMEPVRFRSERKVRKLKNAEQIHKNQQLKIQNEALQRTNRNLETEQFLKNEEHALKNKRIALENRALELQNRSLEFQHAGELLSLLKKNKIAVSGRQLQRLITALAPAALPAAPSDEQSHSELDYRPSPKQLSP